MNLIIGAGSIGKRHLAHLASHAGDERTSWWIRGKTGSLRRSNWLDEWAGEL